MNLDLILYINLQIDNYVLHVFLNISHLDFLLIDEVYNEDILFEYQDQVCGYN